MIDARRAALASAEANAKLAEQNYDRTKQLTAREFASVQKLDEATATLDVAQRSQQQAKLALDEAIAGYTAEERGVAQAAVAKAEAAIATLQGAGGELTVKAPMAAQVYHTGVDPGEYVSPGVPLLTLVDLSDIWLRFDLREDLVKGLKIGDRFEVRVPALGDKPITVVVRKHRHARRICRLARHARDRRLRPPDLRDPRLSGRAGARAAAGHERLRRLEETALMPATAPGLVASRCASCAGSGATAWRCSSSSACRCSPSRSCRSPSATPSCATCASTSSIATARRPR